MNKLYLLILISTITCKVDTSGCSTETVERYTVTHLRDSLVIGQLNFKEVNYYNENKKLKTKEAYNIDGSIKGREHTIYTGNSARSNYYNLDSTLQSYHDYRYDSGFLLEKKSYAATDNILLGSEQYGYDKSGYQTEKIILDKNNIISHVYKFAYDTFGNELGYSVFDEIGDMVDLETYKITELDIQNRWIKKYGERDNLITSYYERKFELK